jgi:uncharacterized damage-inducible protein DinB
VSYKEITVAHAYEVVKDLPIAVRDALANIPPEAAHVRVDPEVWSVAEYVCHLRDVYTVYTIRLHRTRTEDRPVLEPMFNDLRARRFRYSVRDLAPVLDELSVVVAGFLEEVSRTRAEQWGRVATRLPDEKRTARWLVRQAMHEGIHHLTDIRTVGGAATNR